LLYRAALRRSVFATCCCLTTTASLGLVTQGAAGGQWDVSPRFEFRETYTDNVGLTEDHEDSDFITVLRPGVAVRGTGARSELNVDYSLERLIFLEGGRGDKTRHNLVGEGSAELVEDIFFFDLQSAIRDVTRSAAAAASATGLSDTDNRTTILSVNASPSVRHHFGNWADSEFRYTLSRVASGDTALGDTLTNRLTTTVNSGDRFTRLLWSIAVDGQTTDRSSDDRTVERRLAVTNTEYVFNAKFSLLASVGFERIEDDTLADQPDGLIWNGGFRIQPGPRTSVTVTYGNRFEDDNLFVDASYQIDPETTFTATFSDTVQTSQSLVRDDLTFIGSDPAGTLVDTRTGEPFSLTNQAFSLNDRSFRQERFIALLSGSRGRNTFRAQARHEKRTFSEAERDEEVIGGSVGWGRELSRRADANLDFRYRNITFGAEEGREDDIVFLDLRYDYEIFHNLEGIISYDRTMRFSTEERGEFTENAVSLGIRAIF
jgi:uncharacterized protein (PEP-CTERM system associated)